jgi:TorA maturation chaperone TorD
MNNQEKESFCQVMASLFYNPDFDLATKIYQGDLYSFFENYVQRWKRNGDLSKGFLMQGDAEQIFGDLEAAYERLFAGVGSEEIPLIESCYKPWTQDPQCPLPFASEKGLLMGDSALHLSALYRHCSLEVADEFKGCPDHLVMELEFLSYLYRWASDGAIKRFIEDHLDWVPLLRDESKRLQPHPFYASALNVLDLFLNKERERLEKEHEEKKVH